MEVDYIEGSISDDALFNDLSIVYKNDFLSRLVNVSKNDIFVFSIGPEWETQNALLAHKKILKNISAESILRKGNILMNELVYKENYYRAMGIFSLGIEYLPSLLNEFFYTKHFIMFNADIKKLDLPELANKMFDTAIKNSEDKKSSTPDWLNFIKLINQLDGFTILPSGYFDYGSVIVDIFHPSANL